MVYMDWRKTDLEEKTNSSFKGGTDFNFDLGVIDATYNKEELYEKLLEKFMDKSEIKKELESGTVVILSSMAEKKINALLTSYKKLEWTVGLIGRFDREMEAYFVQDVIVCEQEVSSTSVELTVAGNKELAKVKNLIGWCHSHNDMNSFHSGTDISTTSTFGLGMTVNNKRQYDVKIRKDLSIGLSVLVEGVVVRENDVLSDVMEWVEDAKTKIKERTFAKTTNYGYGFNRKTFGCEEAYESELDDLEEDTCTWCQNMLPKSKGKRGFCQMCGIELHKKCMRQISEEGALCSECYYEESVYNDGFSSLAHGEETTYRD